MKSDFIGIGVQKSASTWVYRVLEDHPEVTVSQPKELDFFSNNFDKGIEWYHSHFDKKVSYSKKNEIFGEISPSYFEHEMAASRAYEYNNRMKIVVTLRDPYERAYSNHLHLIRLGKYLGQNMSFEEGLTLNKLYLERSRYFKHLSHWLSSFKRENVLILLQEDIQVDPNQAAIELYRFLNIDCQHESSFLNRRANVSYTVKNPMIESFIKTISKVSVNIGLRSVIRVLRQNKILRKLRDSNKVHLSHEIPVVPQAVKNLVMDELSEDVLKLAALLGRESLPWGTWKYAKSHKCSNKDGLQ